MRRSEERSRPQGSVIPGYAEIIHATSGATTTTEMPMTRSQKAGRRMPVASRPSIDSGRVSRIGSHQMTRCFVATANRIALG